jgi:hypothetical protein
MPPWSSNGKRVALKKGLRLINPKEEDTQKLKRYTTTAEVSKAIEKDVHNKRLWDQISEMEFWSEFEFLQYIFDEAFACSSNACSKPIKVKLIIETHNHLI